MKPEVWRQLEDFLAELLELPAEEQAKRLAEAPQEIRGELESLLQAYRAAGDFMEKPATSWEDDSASRLVGSQMGPYRLIELVATGGMGAVYRGERVDGEFNFEVAIKLVQPGFRNRELLRRLREERQILATLQHPNIARLLDGGVGADGQPYIVMEFVRGTPITAYCREHQIALQSRLELFEQVCAAVHYAHQHLVIHRDIKPGNILVTEEGVPKLLDFGIAKLLAREGTPDTANTITLINPFTPDYASPEQLNRLTVTTASDTYSLGALLYELVTDKKPPRARALSGSSEGQEIAAPATSGPAVLPGDLDRIVRKAMRHEPEERYISAERLAADVANYLAGRPVEARSPSLLYLAGKFCRRHRVAVLSATAGLVLAIVAVSAIVWQAHIARVQRARAQKHFNEVRRLANSLIFDVHDGVANLAGSTPVRKMIVKNAAEYLDALSADAGDDPNLQVEIAEAYLRLASVQSSWSGASLGDTAGATASYGKAEDALRTVLSREAKRRDARRDLAAVCIGKAEMFLMGHDYQSAEEKARQGVEIARQLRADFPQDDELATDYARSLYRLGNVLSNNVQRTDKTEAGDVYAQALVIYDGLLSKQPLDAKLQYSVALTEKTFGSYLLEDVPSRKQEAPGHLLRATELDKARAEADPNNAKAKLDVSFDLSSLGSYYEGAGDLPAARNNYLEALRIREGLASADPTNMFLKVRMAYVAGHAASVFLQMKDAGNARHYYEMEIMLVKAALQRDSADQYDRHYLGEAYVGLAGVEQLAAKTAMSGRSAHLEKRCGYLRQAAAILRDFGDDSESKAAAQEAANGLAECGAVAARLGRPSW